MVPVPTDIDRTRLPSVYTRMKFPLRVMRKYTHLPMGKFAEMLVLEM